MKSKKNATTHGLLSAPVTISAAGEGEEKWQNLVAQLKSELKPEGVLQTHVVEQLAFELLRQSRAAQLEASTLWTYFQPLPDPDRFIDSPTLSLDLLLRYQTGIHKRIAQLMAVLERLQSRVVAPVRNEQVAPMAEKPELNCQTKPSSPLDSEVAPEES